MKLGISISGPLSLQVYFYQSRLRVSHFIQLVVIFFVVIYFGVRVVLSLATGSLLKAVPCPGSVSPHRLRVALAVWCSSACPYVELCPSFKNSLLCTAVGPPEAGA